MTINHPKHVAIIMDGNRRWAKINNYSLLKAYEKGLETLQDTIHQKKKFLL